MGDAFVTEINEAVEYLRRRLSLSGNALKWLEDVKSLNEMCWTIRPRLNEAEEVEITYESAGHCLKNLKKTFNDVKYMRDEFLGYVRRLNSEGARFLVDDIPVQADGSVVGSEDGPGSSSSPHENLAFLRDVVQKVKDLKDRQDKEMMDWDAHAKILRKRYQQKPTTLRPQSTSLMGSSQIIARGDDFEKIKGFLFSEHNGNGNIPIIAIVGMGGLGKTTLAQCVYNDPQVQDYFKQIWVCVSEDFDLPRLTRAMLESLEEKKCDLTQMDPLQRRLKGIVEGKRILLVFDDIWKHRNLNMEAWEALCRPLLGVSTGSKIIVTTRDRNILDGVIMPARVHPLPYLSNDDCFMLFSQYAFEGRDSDIDHNLLDIGKKISNKCRGLPLAAKTLGSLLRGQDDVEKWNDILDNSGIWNSGYQNPVMPVLWLSYQSLPTNLKECFRYCSVFPKDYQFHRDQLINMWIAHGYITQTGEKDLEDIGEEYIKDLVSRSLLDKFEDYEIFIMHHLIHDLARDVSKGEWWRVEYDVFYGNQEDNVHHLSLISTINYPQENVQWSPQIHSLLIFNSSLIFDDIKHLCSRMKHLRVVDMSYSGILNLPESISDLKHLRYLSLQGNQISELPGTVGSLSFLETLNLNNTRMKVLPDSICFLKHLRYLGLQGTCIEYLPESLGMLDQLHTLDVELCKIDSLPDSILNLPSLRRLICNDDIVFSLPFEKLNNLHGRSVIGKEFTDLVNVDEAKKASSYSKEHLNVLSLVWNDNRSPMAYYLHGEVLESLGGLPNLRQLYMQGFAGSSLPSWLTDPHYLPWLVRIDLIRCKNLTSLPPLENFPKLRHVHIESAERLKGLGSQLTGDRAHTNEKPSALRTLAIVDCPNVSSFSVDGCNALQVLKIIICPRLKLSHLVRLRFLQHLSIVSSFEDIPAEFSSGRFPRLERLELKDLPNWRSWGGPKQGECPRLQKLSVAGCKSLENFSISCLHSLKQIFVTNCPNLQALSDRELNIPDCRNVSSFSEVGFSARRILKINRCPSLQLSRLGGLAYLQHLSIKGSNQDIPAYFSFRGFQWLERLELENLPNWRSWEGPKEDECPRLQELSVVDCHSLSHFSISFLQSLKDICVNNCSSLEISISDVIKLLNTERYCVKNILGTKIISHGHNELEQSQGMPYSPRAAFISPERLSLTSNRCPDLTCFPLA